jgi:hypothetical protein
MVPCTYVGRALGVALGGRIRFGSLEFVDTDGPMPVSGFYLGQVLRRNDLDFVADHLGQLHLYEGTVPSPRMPPRDPTPRGDDLTTIDSDALTRRIKSHLGPNPKLEQS